MANALKEFIVNRKISSYKLQSLEIMSTRNGNPMSLNYLEFILNKETAGISRANIEKLDKEFKLTPEEKKSLEGMIKRERGGYVPPTEDEMVTRRERRRLTSEKYEHSYVIHQCGKAREYIVTLKSKAQELKVLLCVDWQLHTKVNKLSPAETLEAMAEAWVKNRTEAAIAQLELLIIFRNFERIVVNGLRDQPELFGKIPSTFQMFKTEDFYDATHAVATRGRERVLLRIKDTVGKVVSHFLEWLQEESTLHNGVVDLSKYMTGAAVFPEDYLHIESWFRPLDFIDLAYHETALFPMMKRIPFLEFMGFEQVITIVENAASKKLADLKPAKASLA